MSQHHDHVVDRIQRGEVEALGELYDQLSGPVYRIAFQITASTVAAEDITKAVFLAVWRSPDVFVRHQDRRLVHLTHCAQVMAAAWCAHHRVTQASSV